MKSHERLTNALRTPFTAWEETNGRRLTGRKLTGRKLTGRWYRWPRATAARALARACHMQTCSTCVAPHPRLLAELSAARTEVRAVARAATLSLYTECVDGLSGGRGRRVLGFWAGCDGRGRRRSISAVARRSALSVVLGCRHRMELGCGSSVLARRSAVLGRCRACLGRLGCRIRMRRGCRSCGQRACSSVQMFEQRVARVREGGSNGAAGLSHAREQRT